MSPVSNAVPFTVLAPALADIPNRELWLDATRNDTITLATGVSAWADKTGNGRTLVQATGGRQPLVVAGLLNGMQGIRFDGVDDRLTLAWPAGAQLNGGSTIFLVASPQFPNTIAYRPLLRFTPSNAAGVQHNSSAEVPFPATRSKIVTFVSTNAGVIVASPVDTTVPGARVITARVSPTEPSITLSKNGVVVAGPVAGFASITSSVGDTLGLCIDDAANIGWYDLFELLVFSRALVPTEQAAVEAFLLTRWGLP